MSKRINPKKKIWQLTIVAHYHGEKTHVNYRETIFSILYNLARLHKLEISTSYNHQFSGATGSGNSQNPEQSVSDLFYLRSTSQSYVPRKMLQKMTEDIFRGGGFYYPVFVYCLYQKDNKKYPFPKDFERPFE